MPSPRDRIVSLPRELDPFIFEASQILKELEFRTVAIALSIGLKAIIDPEREKVLANRKIYREFIDALSLIPPEDLLSGNGETYQNFEEILRAKARQRLEKSIDQEFTPTVRQEIETSRRKEIETSVYKSLEKKITKECEPRIRKEVEKKLREEFETSARKKLELTKVKEPKVEKKEVLAMPQKKDRKLLRSPKVPVPTITKMVAEKPALEKPKVIAAPEPASVPETPRKIEMLHTFSCSVCGDDVSVPHEDYHRLKQGLALAKVSRPNCTKHGGYLRFLALPLQASA